MPVRRPLSIRWWLGALVAAVAVPLLALLVWIYASQVQREELDTRETALRIAKTAAVRIRTLHRDSMELLDRMVARPAIRDYDGKSCDSLFAIIDFCPQYADLSFFDPNGRLLCSAEPDLRDMHISLVARQWIESELKSGRLQPGVPIIRQID